MSQRVVSGTFSGTGNSSEVACTRALIAMTFAGTATVNLQAKVDDVNWVTVASYTATDVITWDPGVNCAIRLNCSAHTNNVDYVIRTV